jgi:hypothetical protein
MPAAGALMARRWTRREDAALARFYRDGVAVKDIAARLERSEDGVNARRLHLGIPARRARMAWSEREDAVLAAATRARLPAAVVAERVGRPVGQVRWRRRILGLVSSAARAYTAGEDTALHETVAAGGSLEELARRLERSPGALRLRAANLGLHSPVRRQRWSAGEDAALRDGYDTGLTCREIAGALPGRTPGAVAARARKLGLATHARRWTAADDQRLRRLAREHNLDDLPRLLGRTPDALRQRARRLRLVLPEDGSARRRGKRWTDAEDELLRLHPGLNPATLAGLLARSDRAITIRLAKLGLRSGRERSPHHAVSRLGDLTPGEQALLDRELDPADPRRLLTLARRLALPSKVLAASNRQRRDDGPTSRSRSFADTTTS